MLGRGPVLTFSPDRAAALGDVSMKARPRACADLPELLGQGCSLLVSMNARPRACADETLISTVPALASTSQ